MFRMVMLVEDKKLAKAMKAVDGLSVELEVHPVKGVDLVGGQLQSTSVTASEAVKKAVQAAVKNGKLVLSTVDLRNATAQQDVSRAGLMYGIKVAKQSGFLKSRTRGQYSINKDKLHAD